MLPGLFSNTMVIYSLIKPLSAVAVDVDMCEEVDDTLDTIGHTVDQDLLFDPPTVFVSAPVGDKVPDKSTDSSDSR